MNKNEIKAVGYAIAAAVFYALNVPCSKLLLKHIAPTYMAALLYIGAGIGVGVMYLFHHKNEKPSDWLAKNDMKFRSICIERLTPLVLL